MNKPVSERINLKNPWLAAFLAFLLPGLGHLYQGRWFKGILFAICILGTFYCGVSLGEGRTVYTHYYTAPQGNQNGGRPVRNYGYFSQVLVGLPALPAIYQSRKYKKSREGRFMVAGGTLEMPFDGTVILEQDQGIPKYREAHGVLKISSTDNPRMPDFEFKGEVEGEEKDVHLKLATLQRTGSSVYARPRWHLTAEVESGLNDPNLLSATLQGNGQKRAFMDWYQIPLEHETLQDLNGRLGRQWDLAMVFTWVAGLLNILAIWDSLEGPAYGYGDEVVEKKDEKEPKPAPAAA